MHKYLHHYEDFLLINDDYVVRPSSKIADGPGSRPHWRDPDDGEDDDYDDYDEYDEYDEYDDDRYDRQ